MGACTYLHGSGPAPRSTHASAEITRLTRLPGDTRPQSVYTPVKKSRFWSLNVTVTLRTLYSPCPPTTTPFPSPAVECPFPPHTLPHSLISIS